MKLRYFLWTALTLLPAIRMVGQGTVADYKRAYALQGKFSNDSIYDNPSDFRWVGDTHKFWYAKNTPAGRVFVAVDAENHQRTTYRSMEELNKALGIKEERDDNPWRGRRQREWWRKPPAERHWMEVDDERGGDPVLSPDSTKYAFIKNDNIYICDREGKNQRALSLDGTQAGYYSSYITWSPDGRYVAACRIRPVGEKRYDYYVESSPSSQLQPILHKQEYAKPGDELPFKVPCIYEVATGRAVIPSTDLFSKQFDVTGPAWNADSRAVTFEYNQRGHQIYRVLELSAETGKVRTLVEESNPKYINYNRHYRYDFRDGKRMLWLSERDNWTHLYLYDRTTGKVKKQLTHGAWVIREVLRVDEDNNVIYFTASGMNPKEDPYQIHYYRMDLNGNNMVCLTPHDGQHSATFSSDYKYLVDRFSKADKAPVSYLVRTAAASDTMKLESANIQKLLDNSWVAPEIFTAPGRDGKTPMWGIIQRPTHFDPSRKYPVIEYIYAGPGDAYTPKGFIAYNWESTALAELGFVVVQLDAMGTSYRGKKFEEVCYKNLKDAGFPDRMAWIRAAAAKYPYMDATKVGIFGASAGGQESTTAVLLHPDFYKAAYSSCGCHDNRMDKIWWNEQWMGYPVDSSYVECSNVYNAPKLTRPLMLVVGELDDNVDPSSTMQVVNALVKANKDFELVVIPGVHHTMGESFGEHKRFDFFVRNLLGVTPPKWDELTTDK
jgi:dipeptidyl aminopeptidase/acylaminoacyl peptidase